MKKIKLKPCPFCGGKADVDSYYSNNGFFDEPTKIYKVFCQDCLCQTDEEYIKDKAIESWNRRTNDEMEIKPGK